MGNYHFHYHFTITVTVKSNVTTLSMCFPFNRLNRTNHIIIILQVPMDYHFIPRSYATINQQHSPLFTLSLSPQMSQLDLCVFISTPGSMGLLISSILLSSPCHCHLCFTLSSIFS